MHVQTAAKNALKFKENRIIDILSISFTARVFFNCLHHFLGIHFLWGVEFFGFPRHTAVQLVRKICILKACALITFLSQENG